MNQWVAVNDLIRKFVGFVNGIAEGRVVREPVSMLAPRGKFKARQISEDDYLLEPSSYARYGLFVDIVESVDAQGLAEFYVLISPLLNQAYSELGLPGGSMDETVYDAIGRLLEVPVVKGDIRLKRPVVMYEFADPSLEGLSAAQKQLLRMGPDHTERLQDKLSEFARALRMALEAQ
jgi:hypothetical protein